MKHVKYQALSLLALIATTAWYESQAAFLMSGANVNISRMNGNQHESTLSIDPTNPQRMFAAANLEQAGNFVAYSTNGGTTWYGRVQGGGDGTPAGSGDVQSAWDRFGNLYLTYLSSVSFYVVVVMSTNGGITFSNLTTLPFSHGNADQPSIAVGSNSVWVSYTDGVPGLPVVAAGAAVHGLGAVDKFTNYALPYNGAGGYGDVAVGPSGQVLVCYQYGYTSGAGPDTIVANLNPTGIGGSFGNPLTVTTTQVGGKYPCPAQSNGEGIDAEANLAWDRSNGPHAGRVHLVYLDAPDSTSSASDVYTRFSDNNGATWSNPVRVTDDEGTNSKFMPSISVDQTSGAVGVAWYDARNDNGQGPNGAAGDTDGTANNDAQLWCTFSTNAGASFLPNAQVSAGTSHSASSEPPPGSFRALGYGDFNKSDFHAGTFFRVWADNSNSTGDNPNGALSRFDIYTAAVNLQSNPALNLGIFSTSTNTVAVSWSAPATGWTLQQNSDLNSTNWVNATDIIRVVGTNNQIVVPAPAGNLFYRLVHP